MSIFDFLKKRTKKSGSEIGDALSIPSVKVALDKELQKNFQQFLLMKSKTVIGHKFVDFFRITVWENCQAEAGFSKKLSGSSQNVPN